MFEHKPATIDSLEIQQQVTELVQKYTNSKVKYNSLFKEELGLDDGRIRDICMAIQVDYHGQLGTCLTDNLAMLDSSQSIVMRIMSRMSANGSYRAAPTTSCMDFSRFNIVHNAA